MATDQATTVHMLRSEHDVFGYDQHMCRYARAMSFGVTIAIFGFALGSFLELLPQTSSADMSEMVLGVDKLVDMMSKELVKLPEHQQHPETFLADIFGVLIGYIIMRRAKDDHDDYVHAFPSISAFYDAPTKRAARTEWVLCALGGVLLIACGFAGAYSLAGVWASAVTKGLLLTCIAIGVGLMVYGYHMGTRTDLFLYNFRALRITNIYEIAKNESEQHRALKIEQKRLCDTANEFGRFATILGIVGALLLRYMPTLQTSMFWIPIVIMLIVSLIVRSSITRYARSRFYADFS